MTQRDWSPLLLCFFFSLKWQIDICQIADKFDMFECKIRIFLSDFEHRTTINTFIVIANQPISFWVNFRISLLVFALFLPSNLTSIFFFLFSFGIFLPSNLLHFNLNVFNFQFEWIFVIETWTRSQNNDILTEQIKRIWDTKRKMHGNKYCFFCSFFLILYVDKRFQRIFRLYVFFFSCTMISL